MNKNRLLIAYLLQEAVSLVNALYPGKLWQTLVYLFYIYYIKQ